MVDFQQKRKIRRFIHSKISLVILVIFSILALKGAWDVYGKARLSGENLARVQKEYTELYTRKQSLEAAVGRLSTDRGTEEEIRSKFQVAKEGENVVVIVDEPLHQSASDTASSTSFWTKFKGLFQ